MESSKSQEKVGGRFEKVLRYYWDGVPVPLLCCEGKQRRQTFVCRKLAFTPDYHGETVELPLVQTPVGQLFKTLCECVDSPQSVSCRIGSHYSPHVGLFRFEESKSSRGSRDEDGQSLMRVPTERCDPSDDSTSAVSAAHRRIRTAKMVALYKPLIKEYSPLSRHSLRRILILSSKGCTAISKEIVAREICDVNEAYAEAESEAIFYYMCLDPLFRQILAPLQLATQPEPIVRSVNYTAEQETSLSRERFKEAKEMLESRLFWNPLTRQYFRGLESMWESRFRCLRFFNMDAAASCTEVVPFLSQVSRAMSSAVSRLRIEFYACVEDLFFTHFQASHDALVMTEKEYEASVFKRVFIATEVFLVNKVRVLFFDALDQLVQFFECGGVGNAVRISQRTHHLSLLRIDLVASESFQPRAPSLSLLLFGIADLFAEMEKCVNGLPRLACAIFRTLRLSAEKLNVVAHVELASYRASLTAILEGGSRLIDGLLLSYSKFCTIPVHNLAVARTGSSAEVAALVVQARQSLTDIRHVSHDVLYYGRLEIHCRPLRAELEQQWNDYLVAFVSAFQSTVVTIVDDARAKSRAILDMLQGTPSTVEELEQHLRNAEAARLLADELCVTSHGQIVDKVSCIEGLFIPVEDSVCRAVFEFKELPGELRGESEKSRDIRARCAPLLQRKLENLRTTIRDYYRTLATGVKELYHMFNLDTCDIAAQTCTELRKLVSRIADTRKSIEHEVRVLALPSEDTFDEHLPLMNHFEIIEQFWITVFESTKVRELYRTPVSSINATGFVERVREWRRLIHSSIRNLRAYPALVRLGREQELALAKFEELELFLELITTPGLRKSHWRDIAKLIAAQLRDDMALAINMSVTLKRLLDAGLLDHIAALAQIVSQARCDYEVENELEEMRSYAKRTHFALESLTESSDPNVQPPQESRREMLRQIEEYVLKCRAMRRRPNLGPPVLKSVDEWVEACEKSREVLLAWDPVKTRWMRLRACQPSLRGAVSEGICSAEEARAITQHLSTASDAFKGLCAVLRKPQFSLYTAMMQDTVQDFLLTVRSGADDAAEVLRGVMERRRTLFPRFRFVPDAELLGFQSAQRAHGFVRLLQYLYPRITDVEVVDGMVTAVVAMDGASLPLSPPLALTKESPDIWIQRFDRSVRASLVAAVKSCVAAYYRHSLEAWLRLWCGQVTVLALRVLHTEGLQRVLQLASRDGLSAYVTKVADLCAALSRLAQGGGDKGSKSGQQQRSFECVVAAALAYEEFALRETRLAVEWHIGSLAELESTRVVQTHLTAAGDGIGVRVMGVEFDYGLEFLGHGGAPAMMGAAQWVQMAPVLVDMELTGRVPLVRGGDDVSAEGELLEAAAALLGRFFVRVEVTQQTPAESLHGLLRGCVGVGALVCLVGCEAVPRTVLEGTVLPLATLSVEQHRSALWQLPYGGHGEGISVSAHPLFRLALSAAAPVALPRALDLVCREVRVAPVDIQEALHEFLTSIGVVPTGHPSAEESEFAQLYRQLQELHPSVFTVRRLRLVLREAFAHLVTADGRRASLSATTPPRLVPRLLSALGSVAAAFFNTADGAALRQNLEIQIEAGLLLPSCRGVVPRGLYATPAAWSMHGAAAEAVLQRFATWMDVHRRVLLVGPQFSGKTRLWRRWAGARLPLIFSPALISAADFYGTLTEPGFLSLLAAQAANARRGDTSPLVVMEDVGATHSSFALFLGSWPHRMEGPEGDVQDGGGSALAGPLVRVVGTARALRHATPGTVNRFALMALAGPSSWVEGILHALGSMPDATYAARVLEMLLPPLMERAAKASPEIVGMASEVTNMYAVAQRTAALCRRWYTYALTLHTHRAALELQEDDGEVPLRLFAVRCAVMAAVWSVGLALPVEDRDVLKLLLLGVETDVMRALADCELSGEVFPSLLQDSPSLLGLVVLPQGWMPFEEAAARTDLPLTWSAYCHTNPHLSAGSQVFALPSRVATLRATECLINCGQHVLLHAGPIAGKSTLLHTMKANEVDWVAQVYDANGGLKPIQIQKTMAKELVQGCDGRFSPTLGRRLVVCVDDVHLAPLVVRDGDGDGDGDADHHAAASITSCFMRFCDKFQAISTPRTGTMLTTNVVFCSTALLHNGAAMPCSAGALGGCVDVRLPAFESDELANGVFQLCTMASSRKRTRGFPQGCATFLDLVHGAYSQLLRRGNTLASCVSVVMPPCALTPMPSASNITPSPSQMYDTAAEEAQPLERPRHIPSHYSEHFRKGLQAAEKVRLHLLSNASDVQVAVRVFLEVTAFYEEQLRMPALSDGNGQHPIAPTASPPSTPPPASPPKAAAASAASAVPAPAPGGRRPSPSGISQALRTAAVEAAKGTMRDCIRGSVDFSDLFWQLPVLSVPDVITPEDESFVADCIAEFSDAVQDEREEGMAAVEERRGLGSGAWVKGSAARAEARHVSVVVSYPDFLKKAAVRSEGAHKEMLVRRSSSVAALSGHSSLRGSFTITPGSGEGPGLLASMPQHLQTARSHPSARVRTTPTYQTTWLTSRLVFLQDTLSLPHAHVMFLGEHTFGLRRLFRLWCASTHVPFMWFRAHPSASATEASATFLQDLRAAITHVCMHSIHVVAYVPPELLRLPEVLRIVDLLVRSGNVSDLFTDEERHSLMRGFHVTHPRSLRPFTLTDDTELRDRLRGCINFVFHLRDAAEMEHAAAAYPFLRQPKLSVLPLHTDALRSALVRELVLSVLRSSVGADGSCDVDGIPTVDDEDTEEEEEEAEGVEDGGAGSGAAHAAEGPVRLSQRATCDALCAVFAHVSERHPTSLAQLVEFVSVYRELRSTARVQVLESAKTGTVIMSRGDEAMKMVSAAALRARAIAEELTTAQQRIVSLTERLRGEESQHAARLLEAEAYAEMLERKKASLEKQRTTLADALQKVEERLEKAARLLRKARTSSMRTLAASRAPDKGTLLVRSLYALLGDDIPKHNDNPHELWSIAMKRVCTKEFTTALTELAPLDSDGAALMAFYLPMRQELDAVRYAPALPYAQLLSDFVVAWVDCGRFRMEDYVVGTAETAAAEKDVREGEGFYTVRLNSVQAAELDVSRTKTELDAAQRTVEALQAEQRQLADMDERLMKYTGLVDRFARFLVAPADAAERLRFVRCVTADTLLVAAYYALLAMHDDAVSIYHSLQKLLLKTVHPRLHASAPQEAFAYMLYQTHAPSTRALMLPRSEHFAWEYRALIMALLKRIAHRWTLVGAATPLIEQEICKYLTLSCTGCVVVSSTDATVREQLVSAMRAGEGVLLRDVHDAATLDFIRYLNPLYAQLRKRWSADTRTRRRSTVVAATARSSQTSATFSAPRPADDDDTASRCVSLLLEGREVRVHPSFFMVCVSSLAVAADNHAASDAVSVYNLGAPTSRRLYYECLLRDAVCTTAVSTKMCSMREEVTARQQGYFRVLQDFIQAHDAAAKLLAANIADIRGGPRANALVADADRALADVDMFEGQLSQTVLYWQSWQKVVQDGWEVVLPALEAVASFAELVEVHKLRRPWNTSALDGCIAEMVRFPPIFMRRFAPQMFSDLAPLLKCFYATVNYVQRVVEQLSAGWPGPVRGIFSLLLLASAMAAAPAVFAAKPEARLLTAEQTRVLQVLLRDGFGYADVGGTAHRSEASISSTLSYLSSTELAGLEVRRGVRKLLVTSEDALLRHVARRGSAVSAEGEEDLGNRADGDVGESQFYVAHLFSAFVELHVEQADHYATSLYGAFMESVTGVSNVNVTSVPRPVSSPEDLQRGASGQQWSRTSTEMASHRLSRAESGMGSSRSDGGERAADEVVPREVISVGTQMVRAAAARQPLCLITDTALTGALSWLRHEAEEAAFDVVWRELTMSSAVTAAKVDASAAAATRCATPTRVTFASATQTLLSLLRQSRLSGKGPGSCLVLVVDGVVDGVVDEGGGGAATVETHLFREGWQRLLSLYSSLLRSASGRGGPSVCLTVLCSPATERVLWGDETAGHVTPCCYVPLCAATPQLRLLELLQPTRRFFTSAGAVQVCESILQVATAELAHCTTAGGARKSPPVKPTRVRGPALAKLTLQDSTTPTSVPLPPLPYGVSSSALTVLQSSMGDLLSCASLVHYELVVSHVVSSVRERARCGEDARATYVDDPATLVQLHDLLSAWMLRNYEDLVAQLGRSIEEEAQAHVSNRGVLEDPTKMSAAASSKVSVHGDLPLPLPSLSPAQRDRGERKALPYALKAYYYLRRRQPAWQFLLEKHLRLSGQPSQAVGSAAASPSAERLTHAVLSMTTATHKAADAPPPRVLPSDDSSMVDAHSPSGAEMPSQLERSHRRSAQRGIVERAMRRWRMGLFALARQFAFFILSHQCSGALPASEQQTQWAMLRALIGAPLHADEVPCLWGHSGDDFVGGEGWQSLLLDARHLNHFRLEVDMFPSDLMELCGEPAAAKRLRRGYQDSLLRLCFRSSDSVATESSPAIIEVPFNTSGEAVSDALGHLLHARNRRISGGALPIAAEEVVLGWEESPLRGLATQSCSPRTELVDMLHSLSAGLARQESATAFVATPTRVWLPSLRHPLLVLESLTTAPAVRRSHTAARDAIAVARAPFVVPHEEKPFSDDVEDDGQRGSSSDDDCDVADDGTRVAPESRLILVVTQERYLLPSDVVLSGARLSSSLEQQLAAHTPWTAGEDDDVLAGGYSTSMVVVARRVLIRPRVTSMEGSARGGSATARVATHEVGQRMWPAASAEVMTHGSGSASRPQLRWCAIERLKDPANALLWDTKTLCRPVASPAARASPTTPDPSRLRDRPASDTFITEVEPAGGAMGVTATPVDPNAPRGWTVTEVPIPVRWNPSTDVCETTTTATDNATVMLELHLCVEYASVSAPDAGDPVDGAYRSPLSMSLTPADGVDRHQSVWESLRLHETLDAYVWIE